jgi:serine/threonine-protein kinase
MTKPGARAATTSQDDEAELTTRQILASAKRMKVSVPIETGVSTAGESDDGSDPNGSSARMSVGAASTPTRANAPRGAAHHGMRLGPYQIVCELASGGMATVYLALYRSVEGFEKLCAVKRIHPHLANDRQFTNMFTDEAQIAARISHPYVCSVFSFGRSQHSPYIAMEFLRGEPLSAITRRVTRSPELGDDPRFPAIAARLVAHFAEGLHAAHTLRDDHGISFEVVHRDVTPQNLFVLYDGSVRVTDFGIAHARRRLHHTEGQQLKGKLSYVAPEQLKEGNVDLRVDVWGLGVTLWELLAGRRLFLGSSEGETLSAVMSRVVQPPSHFRANVPLALDRIVLRALERDMEKRYRSARDLARDLERFLKSIGDQVPAMDVADWMASVFPRGGERIQTLIESAARVSAATADETVVRVPSSPPTSLSSFAVAVAPRVTQPESRPPQQPKARLTSVEETTDTRSLAAQNLRVQQHSEPLAGRARPALSPRVAVWACGGLLLVGLASLAAWSRWSHVAEVATAHAAAAQPAEARAPQPSTVGSSGAAEADQSADSKPPLSLDSLPLEPDRALPTVSRTAAPVRAVTSAPAATASVEPTGVVFITTPGGSGELSERGRSLGRAPGTFRLGVGAHELSLRAPSGAVRTLHVNIKADAPTLVTVNGSQ